MSINSGHHHDPIFAAIDNHKAANAAFLAALNKTAWLSRPPSDLAAATEAASEAEVEARHDMHEVVPQTIAGLAAYVAYWSAFVGPDLDDGLGEVSSIGWEAISTIAQASAALFPTA
ncbi:hypothetical protein [Lichenihabitans psoromatis]|uniref:hypothetical protein n=1 Tax=Lichenihabitans psoromatis TaxID=2528642 RepID=UPI001036629C|nr:hypothetical protein [Lichenihabitans psoromatis]